MHYTVALDGPSGAGKSTVATMLATKLNIIHFDTGEMYRALGLKLIRLNIGFEDEEKIYKILDNSVIEVKFSKTGQEIYLDGENVSELIHEHSVSQAAASVSVFKNVRQKMASVQREIAKQHDMVIDGRDIGTFVLPDATFKFYLTAAVEERARRRYEELNLRGQKIDYNVVYEDIKKRDFKDMTREVAPLKQADDAVLIDSTYIEIEEVVEKMLKHIKERL